MELKLGYDTPETVRELFAEYTHMLVENDPHFQVYLDLQHYDAEVADLTKKYGMPGGRLYVAWCDGQPAGCIALRRLDDTTCELKRLYVRPAFRGRGIAGLLLTARKLTGIMINSILKTYFFNNFSRPNFKFLFSSHFKQGRCKSKILKNIVLRKQIKILKNKTKVKSFLSQILFLNFFINNSVINHFAVYGNRTRFGKFKKVYATKKRCFA